MISTDERLIFYKDGDNDENNKMLADNAFVAGTICTGRRDRGTSQRESHGKGSGMGLADCCG